MKYVAIGLIWLIWAIPVAVSAYIIFQNGSGVPDGAKHIFVVLGVASAVFAVLATHSLSGKLSD